MIKLENLTVGTVAGIIAATVFVSMYLEVLLFHQPTAQSGVLCTVNTNILLILIFKQNNF